MTPQKALKIVETALMNYVNDSAGEGSEETKEIDKAFKTIQNNVVWNNAFIDVAQGTMRSSEWDSACEHADEVVVNELGHQDENEITDEMIDNALDYTSMDRETLERVLREVNSDEDKDETSMMDTCHDDFQIAEQFEWVFTIRDFFEQIK